jgi:hypothetical protein
VKWKIFSCFESLIVIVNTTKKQEKISE